MELNNERQPAAYTARAIRACPSSKRRIIAGITASMLLSLAVTQAAVAQNPTISIAPQPNDRLDVSQCVADCFEKTFSYSMPSYTTRGTSRSISLVYRSRRAHPYGKVEIDVRDASAPSGATFLFQLQDPGNNLVTFTNGSPTLYVRANTSGTTRIAAEFDAIAIPTGRYGYTVTVQELDVNGNAISGLIHAYPGVIIINDAQSYYGAGFEVAGTQRLFVQSGGVLVTDASGSAVFFAGSCSRFTTCSYTTPAGEFSNLQTNGLGSYIRYLPDGSNVRFSASGYETAFADRFGNNTAFAYRNDGPAGRINTITDPAGTVATFDYQTGDMPQWKTYSLKAIYGNGRNAYFGIDNSYHFTDFVDVDGANFGFASYDSGNRLIHFQDRNGNGWDFFYHGTASLDSILAPAIDTSGGYGRTARPATRFRESSGILLAWLAQGHGGSLADAAAAGLDARASVTSPRGYATYFTLTRYGSPSIIQDAVNAVSTLTYDSTTMQLKRVVTPSGHDMNYVWDGPRLTVDSDATTGVVVHTAYETQYNQPTHIWGKTTERWFTYKTTQTGSPLQTSKEGTSTAPTASYVFDSYGRLTQFTDPMGHTTTYSFAATGAQNLYQVTEPGSRTWTYTTDQYGRVTQVSLPDGSTKGTGFDNLNRITWTAGSLGDTTRFGYNNLYLTSVTDARGHPYSYQPNALGLVERETRPGSSSAIAYAYDVDGNLYKRWNRQGYRIDFSYDALGRLTKRERPSEGGNPTSIFTYDPNQRWFFAGNADASDTIYYDAAGRITEEVQKATGLPERAVKSYYDNPFGKRNRICMSSASVPGGVRTCFANVYFDYNVVTGHLSTITDPGSGRTDVAPNADDLPAAATFGGGSATLNLTRDYSSVHQQSTSTYDITAVNIALYRSFQQDKLDRFTSRLKSDGTNRSYYFDYNGQLTGFGDFANSGTCHLDPDYGRVCTPAQQTYGEGYSYDLSGNRTVGAMTVDPNSNRLTTLNGVSVVYDADGNLIDKTGSNGHFQFYWNSLGQLESVRLNGSVVASYRYDAFGRRISKDASGQTRYYLWDNRQIASEMDGAGNTLVEYSYYPGTDNLHAVSTPDGNVYYAAHGEQSDVVGLIRGSDKTVQAQYAYRPFGTPERNDLGVAGNMRWRGLPYDAETGLYYVRARYYDAETGRFLSEDPIGLDGGINQYAFGGNDPINHRDPSGLCEDGETAKTTYRHQDDGSWVEEDSCYDPGKERWYVASFVVWGNAPPGALGVMIGQLLHPVQPYLEGAGTAELALVSSLGWAGSAGVTVMGNYPTYLRVAGAWGAHAFNLMDEIFENSPALGSAANRAYFGVRAMLGNSFRVTFNEPGIIWNEKLLGNGTLAEIEQLTAAGYRRVGNWFVR